MFKFWKLKSTVMQNEKALLNVYVFQKDPENLQ